MSYGISIGLYKCNNQKLHNNNLSPSTYKIPKNSLPPLEDKEIVRKSIHELSSKVTTVKDNYHGLIGKFILLVVT